jgi:hypothetical protein
VLKVLSGTIIQTYIVNVTIEKHGSARDTICAIRQELKCMTALFGVDMWGYLTNVRNRAVIPFYVQGNQPQQVMILDPR